MHEIPVDLDLGIWNLGAHLICHSPSGRWIHHSTWFIHQRLVKGRVNQVRIEEFQDGGMEIVAFERNYSRWRIIILRLVRRRGGSLHFIRGSEEWPQLKTEGHYEVTIPNYIPSQFQRFFRLQPETFDRLLLEIVKRNSDIGPTKAHFGIKIRFFTVGKKSVRHLGFTEGPTRK